MLDSFHNDFVQKLSAIGVIIRKSEGNYMRFPGIFCTILCLLVLLLTLVTPFSVSAADNPSVKVVLTDVERQWLKAHPVITLAPDPDFKPIESFDKNGNY